MTSKLNPKSTSILFVSFVIVIATIEFLLPVNPYIPKLSSLIVSLEALYKEYALLKNIIISISTFYASLFITYFVGKLMLLIHANNSIYTKFENISNMLADSVPSIIIGFVIIMWMPLFSLASFIFILLVLIIQVNSDVIKFIKNVPIEYVDALQSHVHNLKIVRKEIYAVRLKSNILNSLIKHHKYLWTLLIYFEFANGMNGGLGFLIKLSLDYWNSSFLFTILTILILIVFIGEYLLRVIFKRLFPWSELN
jgi:ABC-type nitrate/sulfonate/bicarbonate transport system permease component